MKINENMLDRTSLHAFFEKKSLYCIHKLSSHQISFVLAIRSIVDLHISIGYRKGGPYFNEPTNVESVTFPNSLWLIRILFRYKLLVLHVTCLILFKDVWFWLNGAIVEIVTNGVFNNLNKYVAIKLIGRNSLSSISSVNV